MERPPGSLDDLQPPDVSASNIPAVIDLTKRAEDGVLGSVSLNALRMVKTPGWYQNPGTTSPGLQLPDPGSSDVLPQSADRIQPDDAFSHTTVTLSYVSRSRVFSTHDSLPPHSPVYGVPPISKFSLQPHRDPENRFRGNQRYLEHGDGPLNLEPLHSSSRAQVGPDDDAGGGVQLNGPVKDPPPPVEEERDLPLLNSLCLENGGGESCSSPETLADSLPETPTPAGDEDEEQDGSEVLFIMSQKQDSVAVPDDLPPDRRSLSREFRSPLEDPLSPSATSLDGVEDVFVLPQASSSPSAGNAYLEMAQEADALSSGGVTGPIDLTVDVCASDHSENDPNGVVPHMNGNAETLDGAVNGRKLPLRPGRGARLDAIVMNINSGRYNLSGCILTTKKPRPNGSKTHNSSSGSRKRNDSKVKTSFAVKTVKRKALKVTKSKVVVVDTDGDSTSDSELVDTSQPRETPRSVRAEREPEPSPPFAAPQNSKEQPDCTARPEPPVEAAAPKPNSPKSSRGKTKSSRPPAAKRRRKKVQRARSCSAFPPQEPEIKLRYVSYKEERRGSGSDRFSPFVRVERLQPAPSRCTVVNYPEQVKTERTGRQQPGHAGASFLSAAVPSTSCLQLGRVHVHAQHQRALVCCLCGQSANALDLGDLHGPYYPEGYRPSANAPASRPGLKDEEDDSDSDSSSSSMTGRGRKRAVPPTSWTLRPGPQLQQKSRLDSRRWSGDGSPAAKRARSDGGPADAEDWYSPPVLPQEPSEYWLHEDCGIWSAGVYLVRGKVYGLEEAVKAARETVCSSCHHRGATLGCFFKGCPNKYHYRCALDSDCVLLEENFSMKCKKHKNKTFKAPPGSRPGDR